MLQSMADAAGILSIAAAAAAGSRWACTSNPAAGEADVDGRGRPRTVPCGSVLVEGRPVRDEDGSRADFVGLLCVLAGLFTGLSRLCWTSLLGLLSADSPWLV